MDIKNILLKAATALFGNRASAGSGRAIGFGHSRGGGWLVEPKYKEGKSFAKTKTYFETPKL
jgi:hypothetical protein